MVYPWLAAGYRCTIVDMRHPEGSHTDGLLTRVGCDVASFDMPEDVYFACAFPPCTHLAGSGARWWAEKGLEPLEDALALVRACWERVATAERYMLENPVGRLATEWRQADESFDPCDYGGWLDVPGDHYTKRTCLWTGGDFHMPHRRPVPATDGSRMHRLSSSDKDERSLTPAGFARAVYETNKLGSPGQMGLFR